LRNTPFVSLSPRSNVALSSFLPMSMPTIADSIDFTSTSLYCDAGVAATPSQPCLCKLFPHGGLGYCPASGLAPGRGDRNLRYRLTGLRGGTDSPLPRHTQDTSPLTYKGRHICRPPSIDDRPAVGTDTRGHDVNAP
jgi:hypothetical protein